MSHVIVVDGSSAMFGTIEANENVIIHDIFYPNLKRYDPRSRLLKRYQFLSKVSDKAKEIFGEEKVILAGPEDMKMALTALYENGSEFIDTKYGGHCGLREVCENIKNKKK